MKELRIKLSGDQAITSLKDNLFEIARYLQVYTTSTATMKKNDLIPLHNNATL